MSEVIAGLDIGSRTTRVLLAEHDEQAGLQVSGWGEYPSDGLRKGVVVNIEAARERIRHAVEAAEQEAGRTVIELISALGGASVDSLNSRGVVAVSGRNREIGRADVDRVLEAAKAVVIPMDRDILHVLPQEYIIDDQGGVRNPLDMIGVRLESEVHIVTALVSAVSNMTKAVERADYRVGDVALGTLASARAVLSEDEKDMGVLLLDMGACSTDYIVVQGGAPRLTGSVPIGASQATSDLSIVLKTPMEAAERLKCESGSCWEPFVDSEEPIIVPGVGGRPPVPVPITELVRILRPRIEEILGIVAERIQRSPAAARLSGGVVITGGGALLAGIDELAAFVFNQPARIGTPKSSRSWPAGCRDSRWSTAAGLILLGEASFDTEKHGDNGESGSTLKGLVRWFSEFF